jgi:hypothetical protein
MMPMPPRLDASHSHLVELLEYHDLTNGDLAQMCGVDRTTVTRWTAGTTSVPHATIRLLELMRELKELNGRCRVYWHRPETGLEVVS